MSVGRALSETKTTPAAGPALAIIDRYGGRHGQRVLAAAATVQLAWPAVKWARDKARKEDYTITVAGTDDLYPALHEWVLERIPANARKAMIADSDEGNADGFVALRSHDEPAPVRRVRLRYDGSRTQTVNLDGHKIDVAVAREDLPGGRERLPANWRRLMEKITFTAKSPAGRDAIVRMLERLAENTYARKRPPSLLIPSRWGGEWTRRDDLPPRTLDSVVLKDGQRERVVSDLAAFLAAEDDYGRLSQPWHRGYLFHGEPGTGKTSIARALANHFDLPVYYLPLGDLERDADLMALVGAIRAKSVLLIEDIDVYHAAVERDDTAGKASLAAMLNALDGVWTPHGLITILTTNHIDQIDDALLRAGRVDATEEFTVLDHDQARRLAQFCGLSNFEFVARTFDGRSPAELVESARQRRTA